jgi:hypothetical protein
LSFSFGGKTWSKTRQTSLCQFQEALKVATGLYNHIIPTKEIPHEQREGMSVKP